MLSLHCLCAFVYSSVDRNDGNEKSVYSVLDESGVDIWKAGEEMEPL